MSHDEVQSLLGAYALDALDPEEVAAVEEHLPECPRCRAEVAVHRDTASILAMAGGEAPAGVWDRIAAELGADDAAPDAHLSKLPRAMRLQVRRRVMMPVVAAMATAAAAAAAVLGISAAHLDHRVNVLSSALNAGGLQQAAAAAVLSPRHRAVQLLSTNDHKAVEVVILPDGSAYLVRSDLPALGSDRTYQLWGLVNGKAVSLGLLGSNPQVAAFRVDRGVSRLMVTAEPRGGVPQPDSPVLVQSNVLT